MRNRPKLIISDEHLALVRGLVIYDADNLLAFNKPSGLPVQTRGNRGVSLDYLLWAFAKTNGKRPRLVHRIDAGTSGLVLAARTQPLAAHLSQQFATRRIHKQYQAIVSGSLPTANIGRCDTPILKQGRRSILGRLDQGADPAQTHWRILERQGTSAHLEARPITGRMHQIRVHLAGLNMPIMGDPLYGAGSLTAPRLMLHAHTLDIEMPQSGKLRLEAPVPRDFLDFWRGAGEKA